MNTNGYEVENIINFKIADKSCNVQINFIFL